MQTIDLKKDLKHLYAPSTKTVVAVDVPPLNFLMVDGHGNPNTSQEYVHAVEALYSVAYTLKFALKSEGKNYTVMPLEGLWWVPNMADFSMDNKDAWLWTMMIMQPLEVTPELYEQARQRAGKKKDLPALSKMRLETYAEGCAAQIMHLGPYADEGPNIAKVHEFIATLGGTLTGKHHEIYLSDPRKTAPGKLKTIVRQPYKIV